MNILVTGGTGFVGRRIIDDLARTTHTVVSYNRDYSPPPHPGVHAVQGELFDIPTLVRTATRYGIDTIIHTAAMSHPDLSVDLPLTTFAANVDGTISLFEAARLAEVRRIVNFSSECTYGHQPIDQPVAEATAPMPNTPYAVTKVATEHLGRVYRSLYDLDVVSLRVTEVYGPGLRMPEVLKDMLSAAITGEPFTLAEGGDHPFRFIHVDDAARAAVLAAATAHLALPVYNIAGGPAITLFDLAAMIRRRYPRADLRIGPGPWTGWDVQGPWDISAAARDFDYTPAVNLDDGLDSYARWLANPPVVTHPH